jgi:hypothetical protein
MVLIFDVAQSVFQYANLSIDGDLVKIVAPSEGYALIFEDPFGCKAISENIKYAGAGRISCHFVMRQWFNIIPSAFTKLLNDPVRSVYYSSALFAGLLHVFFIGISLFYVRVQKKNKLLAALVVALLASVFIQYQSFYHNFGIIDLSITYTFFYIFPLLILLLYLLPFFKRAQSIERKKLSLFIHSLLFIGAIFLSFSGPLIQPVVFILFILYVLYYIKNKDKVDKVFLFHLSLLTILCVYAFYVSQFNIESSTQVDLLSRYLLIAEGIFRIVSGKLVWLIVSTGIAFNLYLLKKNFPKTINSTLFKYLASFCFVYLLLLPLGGFRPYRPFIVRYDTFLPVTLVACFVFLITAANLFVLLKGKQKTLYSFFLLIFFIAMIHPDLSFSISENNCQQNSLTEISKSAERVIIVKPQCQILSWHEADFNNPEIVKAINICLKKWKIIEVNQSVVFESN